MKAHAGREHWADVLGCDMRAELNEIRRAAARRRRELAREAPTREAFAAGLDRIERALAEARREKRGERES